MYKADVLSSVLGWISIGCWIIVYSPQLIENYQLKSGEGLSVLFVLIWLTGDIANLLGAILAHLLPTIIVLAVYYSLCDLGLLFQIYYYRRTHSVHIGILASHSEPHESVPLLPSLPKDTHDQEYSYRKFLEQLIPYVLGVFFALAVGAVAFWINTKDGWENRQDGGCGALDDVFEWKSQIFGWTSAILYLGSRIPQILKNLTTKCAGLSPILFFFAIIGNAAYAASILVVSTEARYLAVNASWLAGSCLTIVLDFIVLAQFIYFRTVERVFVPDEDSDQVPIP
ncbi:PQ-loop-domain-containing protein [Ramaria rubella]|nr:PQ-loop-domain-containing protein [Ramaria rubella]